MPIDSDREIIESPWEQGEDEQRAYSLTTTPWGGSPSSPVVKLWDVTDGGRTDVSATKLSGSASITLDVITTPKVISLENGKEYRLEIKFTKANGNIEEAWARIYGKY